MEISSFNFGGHMRGGLSNRVRNNRNSLHVDSDDVGLTLVSKKIWIILYSKVEMSDGDSEDFLEIESA